MTETDFVPGPLDRDATTYVAGHRGMVGSAVWRRLEGSRLHRPPWAVVERARPARPGAVFDHFAETRPRYVVLAAAKVGGILANDTHPVEFLSDNLRIQTNVLDAALEQRVERLLFLGSSCIYPRLAPQPIREDSLLTGHLEPTNDAYAIAKIAGIIGVQAVRREHGLPWISAMPTNLYGPGDNFSPTGSHVLPALIRRYDEAARVAGRRRSRTGGADRRGVSSCTSTTWPTRCLHLLEHYDGACAGQRRHRSRRHDQGDRRDRRERRRATTARPCGTPPSPTARPASCSTSALLRSLGWTERVGLAEGITSTVTWYRDHAGTLREVG